MPLSRLCCTLLVVGFAQLITADKVLFVFESGKQYTATVGYKDYYFEMYDGRHGGDFILKVKLEDMKPKLTKEDLQKFCTGKFKVTLVNDELGSGEFPTEGFSHQHLINKRPNEIDQTGVLRFERAG